MQNVVNYRTPFLLQGAPIVDGRVYFVKENTSALTFNSALDSAFFINIYDKDGSPLQNPLPLDSDGSFSIQPFVEDGLDFKMIVCRPTGISPDLNDESPAWEEAYTMVSKAGNISVSYDGIEKVNNIHELREKDPSAGSVLVIGYNGVNDGCPPRIFTWKNLDLQDNGGTHISSSVEGRQNTGVWVCEPTFYVDVRWFGVMPGTSAASGDCWATLNNIVTTYYPELPLYLPNGNDGSFYNISENLTINALVIDNGVKIRPTIKNILITVNRLENRGGTFMRARIGSRPQYNVYLKTKGIVYSSWFNAPSYQITDSVLKNVDLMVFDSDVNFGNVNFWKKRIVIKDGVTVQGAVFHSCEVYDENSGKFIAGSFELSNSSGRIASVQSGQVYEMGFYLGGSGGSFTSVFRLSNTQSYFISDLKLPSLQVGDDEDFLDGWRLRGDDDPYFPNHRTLNSHYAYLQNVVFGGCSHAKSNRTRITIEYVNIFNQESPLDPTARITVRKGSDIYEFAPVVDNFFELPNLFDGERDFDVLVLGTFAVMQKVKLVLPIPSGEKIVSFAFAANGLPSSTPLGVTLYQKINGAYINVAYEGQSTSETHNEFTEPRLVRKESNGNWFFDPFAI